MNINNINIISFAGISLVILVLSSLIKKYSPEFFIILIIIYSSIFLLFLISYFQDILNKFDFLFKFANIQENLKFIILKILGICIISEFSSNICKDSGNLSLSNNIILFGKISIILIAMPIFKEFFDIILNILKSTKF